LNIAEVKFFKMDYEKVMRELERYAKKSLEKKAEVVILIGSLARGDYTAFSDADVIIITKEASRNPIERLSKYMDPTLPIDLQVRVYTYDELKRMAFESRRIIREIVSYGRILAGSSHIIDDLKRMLSS